MGKPKNPQQRFLEIAFGATNRIPTQEQWTEMIACLIEMLKPQLKTIPLPKLENAGLLRLEYRDYMFSENLDELRRAEEKDLEDLVIETKDIHGEIIEEGYSLKNHIMCLLSNRREMEKAVKERFFWAITRKGTLLKGTLYVEHISAPTREHPDWTKDRPIKIVLEETDVVGIIEWSKITYFNLCRQIQHIPLNNIEHLRALLKEAELDSKELVKMVDLAQYLRDTYIEA